MPEGLVLRRARAGWPSRAHGRSFSGLRTTQIRVTRPSEMSNEATVMTTPARRATRPGTPLTDRSRSSSPGALSAMATMYWAMRAPPSIGRRTVPTMPPPSAVITAAGLRRVTRAAMSLVSHASLTCLTTSARPVADTGARAMLARRRAEAASCLQAAGVRPSTSAISANGYRKTSCRTNATRSAGVIVIAFTAGPRRAEQVQADAAGHRRQPGAGGQDLLLPASRQPVPACVGVLYGVLGLGLGHRTEQPVSEIDQLASLAESLICAGPGSSHACGRPPERRCTVSEPV